LTLFLPAPRSMSGSVLPSRSFSPAPRLRRVELGQVFLPSRYPDGTDVLLGTFGPLRSTGHTPGADGTESRALPQCRLERLTSGADCRPDRARAHGRGTVARVRPSRGLEGVSRVQLNADPAAPSRRRRRLPDRVAEQVIDPAERIGDDAARPPRV
jgi:hypothetical protein